MRPHGREVRARRLGEDLEPLRALILDPQCAAPRSRSARIWLRGRCRAWGYLVSKERPSALLISFALRLQRPRMRFGFRCSLPLALSYVTWRTGASYDPDTRLDPTAPRHTRSLAVPLPPPSARLHRWALPGTIGHIDRGPPSSPRGTSRERLAVLATLTRARTRTPPLQQNLVGAHHQPECQAGYLHCRDARAVHASSSLARIQRRRSAERQGGVDMDWTGWNGREGDAYILHAAGWRVCHSRRSRLATLARTVPVCCAALHPAAPGLVLVRRAYLRTFASCVADPHRLEVGGRNAGVGVGI
jgi:hypothetical protein